MNGCDIGFGTPKCTSIRKKSYCFAQLNSDFIFFFIFNLFILYQKKIRQLVANECENIINKAQNNGPVNCILSKRNLYLNCQ